MEKTTIYVIVAIIAVLVILILFGCFWNKMYNCMSSNCPLSGSSDCWFSSKKGCDGKGYCKKCGTIPCCCNDAEICSVTRTYSGPSTVGEPDEYVIMVEGSGLTSSTITNIIVQVTETVGGAVVTDLTQNYPALAKPIVFGTSGYSLAIVYTTEQVGDNAAPKGPAAVNNMSPLITHVLTGSVLTITVVMPLAV